MVLAPYKRINVAPYTANAPRCQGPLAILSRRTVPAVASRRPSRWDTPLTGSRIRMPEFSRGPAAWDRPCRPRNPAVALSRAHCSVLRGLLAHGKRRGRDLAAADPGAGAAGPSGPGLLRQLRASQRPGGPARGASVAQYSALPLS